MDGSGSSLLAAVELVVPLTCAGCGCPGALLCAGCRDELVRAALPPVPVHPRPPPPGWPGCHAMLTYAGVVPRLVRSAKDGERRDLLPVLGRLLSEPVRRAIEQLGPGPAVLVPAPSSAANRRRRGDAPVETMVRRAARRLDGEPAVRPLLRPGRVVADQAGLGAAARRGNLDGALRVAGGADLRGSRLVVVDDVVTSGATLAEARRVLLAAGAGEVTLAALAATPWRGGAAGSGGNLSPTRSGD